DRIAVMRQGRFEQVGTPSEIYADPRRLFVAAFVGTPRTSLLQAAVYAEGGGDAVLDLGEQVLKVPATDPRAQVLTEHHTARVTAGLRTDAVRLADADEPDALRGKVIHLEHLGNET